MIGKACVNLYNNKYYNAIATIALSNVSDPKNKSAKYNYNSLFKLILNLTFNRVTSYYFNDS